MPMRLLLRHRQTAAMGIPSLLRRTRERGRARLPSASARCRAAPRALRNRTRAETPARRRPEVLGAMRRASKDAARAGRHRLAAFLDSIAVRPKSAAAFGRLAQRESV